MRRAWLLGGCAALFLGGALVHLSGCVFPANDDDCSVFPHAGCGGGTGGADGGTSSSGGNSGHDGGTGGTGEQPNCDPTAGAIAASCGGVFVSSSTGDDGNAGTEAAPLKTLAAAVTKAGAGQGGVVVTGAW
jgi:hypothetical protein